MIEAGTPPLFSWPLRVTKQQWRTVVISIAAVAFSATAGLEPPLRNLITFARAGASFSAKQLCSSVLMAGMDPDQVLKEDLAAGQGMIHTRIKPNAGRVEASALFGLIRAEAIQNGERGCTWQIDGHPKPRLPKPNQPDSATPQPIGSAWPLSDTAAAEPPEIDEQALKDALDRAFEENEPLTPKRTRAVVVVQNGWVIAERYAQGIQPDMPLIGWSMSKSITHALIGRAIQEGLLDPGKPPKVPEWSDPQDPRQRISLDQLLRMNSGLAFEESTGTLNSDLVRMLTQEADMAGFAASQPLSKKPGKKWSYSSGTTNILSRILRHAIDDDQRYWSFPKQALFGPLGMTMPFSKATTVEPWWAHPWCGPADAIGPGSDSCTWIRASGTASNFCPQPGFGRHGLRRGDPKRPMARTGGSAGANQGPIYPTTAFQLRAIRDNFFWWLHPSAR